MLKKRLQSQQDRITGHFVFLCTLLLTVLISGNVSAQKIKLQKDNLTAVQTSMAIEKINGKSAVKVIKSQTVEKDDEPTYVKINDLNFEDGVIEVKVLAKLLPNAPSHARGFIGIAFRINDDDSKFESIYIRPTNGIAEDQLRRNRSIQYFSYPNFKFTDSRASAPGQYEAYADIAPDKWIKLRIEVRGTTAKLFIDGAKRPNLIVNDLKMGAGQSGSIGLWVDIGTEGFFSFFYSINIYIYE
jgi:hypothetical protein